MDRCFFLKNPPKGIANTGNIQVSAAYDGSETLITLYWRI